VNLLLFVQARFSAAKALAHPWISQDGVAPSTPLDISIMQNMKRFSAYNNVKKTILIEVAKTFDPKDIEHLQKQFVLMDVDNSGTITIEEMIRAMTALKTGEDGQPVYNAQQVRDVCYCTFYQSQQCSNACKCLSWILQNEQSSSVTVA
jgi:hypothetical protein